MAQPITWRNINAPSFGDAIQATALAGDSLDRGLSQLKGAADDYSARQKAQADQVTADNTQAILNRLQGINSLDEYNALRESGELSPDRLQGMNVNANQIFDRLNQRDNEIRQDRTEEQTYADQQKARKDKELVALASVAESEGDIKGAEKYFKQTSNPGEYLRALSTRVETSKEKARQQKMTDLATDYTRMIIEEGDSAEPFANYTDTMLKEGASPTEIAQGIQGIRQTVAARGAGTISQEQAANLQSEEQYASSLIVKEDAEAKLAQFQKENPYLDPNVSRESLSKKFSEEVLPRINAAYPDENLNITNQVTQYLGRKYIIDNGTAKQLTGKVPEGANVVTVTPALLEEAIYNGIEEEFFYDDEDFVKSNFESGLQRILASTDVEALRTQEQLLKDQARNAKIAAKRLELVRNARNNSKD